MTDNKECNVTVKACIDCGLIYLLQKNICVQCFMELRIYDLPITGVIVIK